MANIWKPSGSSVITAPTLGSLIGKTIKVVCNNLTWQSGTGYLFSQAGVFTASRFGLWSSSGELRLIFGGVSQAIGSSSFTNNKLSIEYNNLTGDYELKVDDVITESGNFTAGTGEAIGSLFRIGGRGSDSTAGSTASAYLMQDGDQVGDIEVYIDGVLVRTYVMPATGISVPETTSLQDGVLQDPSGDDWVAAPTLLLLDAPTVSYPIYAIGNDQLSKGEFVGAYTDIIPTLIEYRVMRGVTEIVTWSSVDSFGSGSYSFTPQIPPNAQVTIQVRTTVGGTTYENESSPFDVGIVIGIIGSSSAQRMFSLYSGTTLGRVHVSDGTWITTDASSMNGGSAVKMANEIYRRTSGWPVGFYDAGVNGTLLTTDWNPVTGSRYSDFIAMIDDQNITMVYNQAGYNDISASVALVAGDVTNIIDDLRTRYGNVPYIDGLSQRGRDDGIGGQVDFWSIGSAIESTYSDYWINWRIDLEIGESDSIHLSEAAAGLSAERSGAIAVRAITGSGSFQGPQISSASYSGDTINLILDVLGTDYTGLAPSSAMAGFRVTDGAGVVTLTSQVETSKTAITLTSSSTLNPPVSVDFAAYSRNVTDVKAFDGYPLTDGDVSFPLKPLTSPIIALSGSPPDTTPDAFDVGADVTGAALSTEFKSSFVLAGVDESVTVNATDDATISLTENGTYGSSIDSAGGTHWIKITSSALNSTAVTGGASCNGVSDSRTITTLEATPEPDPTLTMPYPLGSESGVASAGTDVPASICVASTMAQVLTTTVTWGTDGVVPVISSDQLTTGVLYNITINDGTNIATYNVTAV